METLFSPQVFYSVGVKLFTKGTSGGIARFEVNLLNRDYGWSLGPIDLIYR